MKKRIVQVGAVPVALMDRDTRILLTMFQFQFISHRDFALSVINQSTHFSRYCCRPPRWSTTIMTRPSTIPPCHSLTDSPVSEGNLTAAVVPHD